MRDLLRAWLRAVLARVVEPAAAPSALQQTKPRAAPSPQRGRPDTGEWLETQPWCH